MNLVAYNDRYCRGQVIQRTFCPEVPMIYNLVMKLTTKDDKNIIV